jgi:7-keto-8-aminopelargonate synthetase-like enzyme
MYLICLSLLMCGAGIKSDGSTQAQPALNFCANNYLGLSNHPEVAEAAIQAIRTHGYGLSSVRFICGTQVCFLFWG